MPQQSLDLWSQPQVNKKNILKLETDSYPMSVLGLGHGFDINKLKTFIYHSLSWFIQAKQHTPIKPVGSFCYPPQYIHNTGGYLNVLSSSTKYTYRKDRTRLLSVHLLLYALDWEYHNQAGSTRQNSCLDFLKLRCPITRLHNSSTNFLSLCSKQCHSESVL